MRRRLAAQRAWAIETATTQGRLVGVGWFDWALSRPGLWTMTFATRREARAALRTVRVPYGYANARVVPVTVIVEVRHA